MIYPSQVADLIEGDVVTMSDSKWGDGVTVTGPIKRSRFGSLVIGDIHIGADGGIPLVVRKDTGEVSIHSGSRTLGVVSRVPRPKPPVYVNSDRTEYAVGDVVTYPFPFATNGLSGPYVYCEHGAVLGSPRRMTHWKALGRSNYDTGPTYNAKNLTLLIDGTTTTAVTS